jgi:hypothetical protein
MSEENVAIPKLAAPQQFEKNGLRCHDDKYHRTPSVISQRQGMVAEIVS